MIVNILFKIIIIIIIKFKKKIYIYIYIYMLLLSLQNEYNLTPRGGQQRRGD